MERGWGQKTLTSRRALRVAFLKDSAQLFGVGDAFCNQTPEHAAWTGVSAPRDAALLPWAPPEEPTPELLNVAR